jgi:hypothetical protein
MDFVRFHFHDAGKPDPALQPLENVVESAQQMAKV